MSKIGPPQLRAKLYMSALCGKIYNKRMRNIYDEMCLRGKPKMVAIGALMRKLVHWCYGVLKTGTVFNDEGLKQVLSTGLYLAGIKLNVTLTAVSERSPL